ncbi:MAG: lysine--tRNA ligase [Gammaproteobacteria bacterium]|nr:lysine--tRNA ligase [Gammaproteobacteria bacterium]MDE0302601.1 lysine--tRNA ligase [Gammaproteobacteria bacterium]
MGKTKTGEERLLAQRQEKLQELRTSGWAYPNDFRPTHTAQELQEAYAEHTAAELTDGQVSVALGGRLMSQRVMGKSAFAHIQDRTGRIQLLVRRDGLGESDYADFKTWDIGDIVGAQGTLMKTKTGELSVDVQEVRLLSKSLRPLPEKYHGLTDIEQRYRQRHVDLIMNSDARGVFQKRSQLLNCLRQQLEQQGFLEVETPMMHSIAGGATARPFVTHHNVLHQDLYLRVAPELYLKRLVVGGFEKVFEINRSFRNEGVSSRHNPEFTMMELYQAFADYQDLMNLAEALMREMAQSVLGSTTVAYQGQEYDLEQPFQRTTLTDAVLAHHPSLDRSDLSNRELLAGLCRDSGVEVDKNRGEGGLLFDLFESSVEEKLEQPTFVTEYPLEVSPLARRCDHNPDFVDRFELFVAGREIANGFSELNDPQDQAERFQAQVKKRDAGDQEAMHYDADYIRALEYGMPPTAGIGIGIDRLVMFFCDAPSIRDVLLFPHMRPEAG